MTDAETLRKLDTTISGGNSIIQERHMILEALYRDHDLSEADRERLTARFFDLEIKWRLLSASCATRH